MGKKPLFFMPRISASSSIKLIDKIPETDRQENKGGGVYFRIDSILSVLFKWRKTPDWILRNIIPT